MTPASSSAPAEPADRLASPGPVAATDHAAIGHLRAFVTLLVLAHHSVLAHHPGAPPPPASLVAQPRWWQAFPVTDTARWSGFSLFVGFNDLFFMALMFFLSGLFVWSGLKRKGSAGFVRDRAWRLGLPFLAAAAVVAPLAYYPAYLQSGGAGLAGFARQWLALGNWPAGPAWFLWVLLAFGLVAALLFAVFPRWGERLGRRAAAGDRRPALLFAGLAAASALAYFPLVYTVGPFGWTAFGPFFFQTSRILHYAVYFLAGIAVGACGLDRGLLAPGGALVRRWGLWAGSALAVYAVVVVLTLMSFAPHPSPALGPLLGVGFVLSCALSSFAAIALFLRFARGRGRIGDSLRANAYGMYLVHYAFASWLQLALLRAPLGGFAKGALATLGTVAFSWMTVAALRRIPAVARVLDGRAGRRGRAEDLPRGSEPAVA
jgi:hypothetical protein